MESCDEWGRPTRSNRQTGADTAAGYRSRQNGSLLSMMLPARRERRTYDPLRLQLTGIAHERCLDDITGCGTVEAVRAFGCSKAGVPGGVEVAGGVLRAS